MQNQTPPVVVRASTMQSRRVAPTSSPTPTSAPMSTPTSAPANVDVRVPAKPSMSPAPEAEKEHVEEPRLVTRSKRRGPNKKPAAPSSTAAKAAKTSRNPTDEDFANVGRLYFEAVQAGMSPADLVEQWRAYIASWDCVHTQG